MVGSKYRKQIQYLETLDTSDMSIGDMMVLVSKKFDMTPKEIERLRCTLYKTNIPRRIVKGDGNDNLVTKRGRPHITNNEQRQYISELVKGKTLQQGFNLIKQEPDLSTLFTSKELFYAYIRRNKINTYISCLDVSKMFFQSDMIYKIYCTTNRIEKHLLYNLFCYWCEQTNNYKLPLTTFIGNLGREDMGFKLIYFDTRNYIENCKWCDNFKIYWTLDELLNIVVNDTLPIELGPESIEEFSDNNIDERLNNYNTSEDVYTKISEEVINTINRKSKLLDCYIDKEYNTQDYINMLEMLQYLCTNINILISKQNDRHDIMNSYQGDVIHTIENVESNGDTYLQDKLHILRNIRRDCEYDAKDLQFMEQFLKSIDINKLNSIISTLKKAQSQREKCIYIPMVDIDMVKKYDWAIQRYIG